MLRPQKLSHCRILLKTLWVRRSSSSLSRPVAMVNEDDAVWAERSRKREQAALRILVGLARSWRPGPLPPGRVLGARQPQPPPGLLVRPPDHEDRALSKRAWERAMRAWRVALRA